ncbi:putative ankyrin repeat protein RF_0381 [Saccostrea cucullata]|uniref:putative ankyrin repeat protein RF_0381 n=1 Tax=Saccostrea cuccullata TaxID=36930 RepID=UPI002ED3CCA2
MDEEFNQRAKLKQKVLLFELTKAITNSAEDVATEMIDSGADLDATIIYSKTPLSYALETGCENIARKLLSRGADPEKTATCEKSKKILRPIHFACKFKQTNFLSDLLKKNVDMEVPCSAGLSALHYAAAEGCTEICSELIKYGADVNKPDTYNLTPLHRAAENGHVAVVELLVNSGADLSVVDNFGNTPLLMACYFNKKKAARSLLQFCNNVNTSDKEGNSSLHIISSFCQRTKESFVKSNYKFIISGKDYSRFDQIHNDVQVNFLLDLLISFGANVKARNNRGLSTFDGAKSYLKDPGIELFLLRKLVGAGLWIQDFSPDTVLTSACITKYTWSLYVQGLSNLQEQQMTLKQQCKNAVRKDLHLTSGKTMKQSIECLPLPTDLKKFLQ